MAQLGCCSCSGGVRARRPTLSTAHSCQWSGQLSSDTAGVTINWQWAAAVYDAFGADYSSLEVKPTDDTKASVFQNSDHAGTPEAFKSYVIGGATGGGGSNFTGSYSGTLSHVCQ